MALLFPKVPFSDAKTELHETGPCPESRREKSVSCSIVLWVHLAAIRSRKKAVECPLVLFPQTLDAPLAQKDPRATYAPRVFLSIPPVRSLFPCSPIVFFKLPRSTAYSPQIIRNVNRFVLRPFLTALLAAFFFRLSTK